MILLLCIQESLNLGNSRVFNIIVLGMATRIFIRIRKVLEDYMENCIL